VHRWLRLAQPGEPHRAHEADDDAGEEPDRRIDQRGDEGDQRWADDEDDLVDHRLEREGGLPPIGVQGIGPAGPHDGADVRAAAAGETGEQEPGPLRRPEDDGGNERDAEDQIARERDPQDDALPAPVHRAGPLRADQGAHQRQRAGDGAGEPVAAGRVLDEQDGAEAEDRHGQPRQPPGQGEGRRAGHVGEDLGVGTEHVAGCHGSSRALWPQASAGRSPPVSRVASRA
jgi:hypothetical protein